MGGQFTQAIMVRFPNLTGIAGDTLTVPLYVDDDLEGNGVISFQFDIGYTSSNAELLGVINTGTVSAGFNELIVKDNLNYFSIAGAGTTPLTGKGILLNIKFVLLKSGTSLQFRNTNASNYFNEGNPALTFTNGYITINAKPTINVYPANAVLNIGESQQFSSNGGTAPYTWSVSDNNIASIAANGMLSILKSGIIKVIATDSKGYRGESGNIDCRSFNATIRDTTFYQNNYFEIPLAFKNLDATPMFAGKFVFAFTQSILSFDSLILTNSILEGIASVEYSKQSGKATISFASSTGIVGSGTLFKLRFKIADVTSGGSYITFDEATINETLYPKSKNGYFSIRAFPTLYISPGSSEMFSGEQKQFTVTGGTSPYTWSTEDVTIASSTGDGYLTANSGGVTKLMVKDMYGAKASGNITVYDTWINVRDSTAAVTQYTLTIPVDLGLLPTGKNIFSLSGKAVCTSTKIDSIQVINSGTLTENWLLANKIGANQSNFALSGTVPIAKTGKIVYFKIYFNQTVKVGDSFNLSCNELILNEGNPNVKVMSGNITINSIQTSLIETQHESIVLYPNPATSSFQLKGIVGAAKLDLFSIEGKLLRSTNYLNNEIVPVTNLAKGIYIVKLSTSEGIMEKKFVKN
jgi:hypothetical protein